MFTLVVIESERLKYEMHISYKLKTERKRKENGGMMKAFLILEDGHVFTGTSIGSQKEVISEIVFNTSMTGYLEVLTDHPMRTGSMYDVSSYWKLWNLL